MLSKIRIDGYKSIDELDLELKDFTLLSGINSAGKSSVIQVILYMMHQQKYFGESLFGADYGDLGKFTDIRNSIKGNKEIHFTLETEEEGCAEQSTACIYQEEDSMIAQFKMPSEKRTENYGRKHKVIYLPVERVGIKKAYELNMRDPREIGFRGEYVFSYLAFFGQDPLLEVEFAHRQEEVGLSLSNQVNGWLKYLMDFQIQTNIVTDVDQVVVTYSNAKNNRYYRAKNVGTGITYMSMLIIAALSCRKGDTLIIENPEIHLHPRAQSRFMEFLAYLSERGLQIIVETHSDHIYNGMRKCVKSRKLAREKIAAYFLELDETMQTKVYRIHLNEQGAEENHPYGMFDQFDDDLDELLDM